MVVISILLFVLLALVTFEDFKTRTVPLWLLLVLGVVVLIRAGMANQTGQLVLYFSINVLFSLAQWLVLTIYFSARLRKPVNIIDRFIGLGDIVYLLICCACFAPLNFIVFQMVSFTLVLVIYVVYGLVKRQGKGTIPLAGSLAVVMNLFLIAQIAGLPLNTYNDSALMQLFM